MATNQGEFTSGGFVIVDVLPTPGAELLGQMFFLTQQDGPNAPGFHAVDPILLIFEEVAGGSGDGFVSTESSISNLTNNFPPADFTGKYAIVNGSPSSDGIYKSNGVSWAGVLSEGTGSGANNDDVADAVTSINTIRGTTFKDWTTFDTFDGTEDLFIDTALIGSLGNWVHNAGLELFNSTTSSSAITSTVKDTVIGANFARGILLHDGKSTAILNTDIKMSVSRDNGVNFTELPLTDSGKIFLDAITLTVDQTNGGTPFASGQFNGATGPEKAFDDSTSSWRAPDNSFPAHVGYEFASAIVIKRYTVQRFGGGESAPKDWTFEASANGTFTDNNGGPFILDDVVDQLAWTGPRDFDIPNFTAFTHYRINISAVEAGVELSLEELDMFAAADAAIILVTDDVYLGAKPEGTQLVWKVESFNSVDQDIHGVFMQWRATANESSDGKDQTLILEENTARSKLNQSITSINTLRDTSFNDWTTFDRFDGIDDLFIDTSGIITQGGWIHDVPGEFFNSNSTNSNLVSVKKDTLIEANFFRAVVLHDSKGESIINEDLVLSVSRDDGANFTPIPLIDSGQIYQVNNSFSTDLTTPGGIIFASGEGGTGFEKERAFDNIIPVNDAWDSGTADSGIIGFEFTSLKTVERYRISMPTNIPSDRLPKDWTFEASVNGTFTDNNGGPFILDTQIGFVAWPSGPTFVDFDIQNDLAFLSYRINITAVSTPTFSVRIGEIEYLEILEPVRILISDDIDLSDEPAGTEVVWKIEGKNSKNQDVNGVWIQWRDRANKSSDGDDKDLAEDITSINTIRADEDDWSIFDKIEGIRDEFKDDDRIASGTPWTFNAALEQFDTLGANGNLISIPFKSSIIPTVGRAVVIYASRDNGVINTDLKFSMSRDGGISFVEETLIDTGFIHERNTEFGPDKVPVMTTATTPSGEVTASSESLPAVGAFDVDPGGSVWQSSGSVPQFLQYEFEFSEIISRYTLKNTGTPNNPNMPKDFTLSGSNTGAFSGEETLLDTQVGQVSWGSDERRTFTFTNLASFKFYRLDISDTAVGTFVDLRDMELIPLLPDPQILTTDDIDLSSEPAGSLVKWKLESLNSRTHSVLGVWMQWREIANATSDGSAAGSIGIVDPVADLTALQALDVTDAVAFPTGILIIVNTLGLYRLDRSSGATADGKQIIDPTTPGGSERWIKISGLTPLETLIHIETTWTADNFDLPNDGSITDVVADSSAATIRTVTLPDSGGAGFILDRFKLNIARKGTDTIRILSSGSDDIILDGVAVVQVDILFNGNSLTLKHDGVNSWRIF